MNLELGTAEIVFAQKLASCEPRIRTKALHRLTKWIKLRESSKQPFSESELLKLWKGLYYCMWMQDKPLLQENLADNIAALIECFATDETKLLFMHTFYATMAREWAGVDRWRMDKFMMLMRRMMRVSLVWMTENDDVIQAIDLLILVWSRTVINAEQMSCPQGLKFHFVSIVLDELDNNGKLTQDDVMAIIKPFIDLLGLKITDQYFDTILKEVFETILLDYEERMGEEEEENSPNEIKFDYLAIGTALFECGKRESVVSSRRLTIYDMVKKFKRAAKGEDVDDDDVNPRLMPPKNVADKIIDKAAKQLINISAALPKKKRKGKQEVSKKGSDSKLKPQILKPKRSIHKHNKFKTKKPSKKKIRS